MTRRAPLPKITECVEKDKPKNGLSRAKLLCGAYPFVVICLLCLAHIHLQFARIDMLTQESQLQSQERMLLRRQANLERQKEALCDPATLKQRALRELNMVGPGNSTARVIADVPRELREKYLSPLKPTRTDVQVAELRNRREPGSLKSAFMTLLDSGRAMASVSTSAP